MIHRLALFAAVLLYTTSAAAWTHIARIDETLEHLAMKYYGNPKLAIVIRAANGFVHPDDGSLTRGERIEIPEVHYHRIRDNETWTELADQYLGSPKRGRYLAQMNGSEYAHQPAENEIVKIPYQILHILAEDETLKSVTRLYFNHSRSPRWLRNYNLTGKRKFSRGDTLLVPLYEVELVDAEREKIEAQRAARYTVEDRQSQIEAAEDIAALKPMYDNGEYIKLVATASQILGRGSLTGPQMIGVYQFLAFGYVALDRNELGLKYFKMALKIQPTMDLSPITTSPKILAIFNKAKKTVMLSSIAKTLDGGTADDGATDND